MPQRLPAVAASGTIVKSSDSTHLGTLSGKLLTRFASMSPLVFQSPDNQEGSDWRDEDEKLPGHENLTEKDIELFRHIQELALQVHRQT